MSDINYAQLEGIRVHISTNPGVFLYAPLATNTKPGVVKGGAGVTISEDGTLSTIPVITRITIDDDGHVSQLLKPDIFYDFTGTLSSLTLTLDAPVPDRENEYKGQFLVGNLTIPVTFPAGIVWVGEDDELLFEENKLYQFSILNNVGILLRV